MILVIKRFTANLCWLHETPKLSVLMNRWVWVWAVFVQNLTHSFHRITHDFQIIFARFKISSWLI